MSSEPRNYLLSALLGILPVAMDEAKSAHANAVDSALIETARRAIQRYWQDHAEDSKAWQIAARRNDNGTAVRLCMEIERLDEWEAMQMVEVYRHYSHEPTKTFP